MTQKYKDSGVDINAGNEVVRKIGEHLRSTFRPEVLSDIGGFGGFFALNTKKYKEPVLVSGTDGVGTKLKVAFMMNKHDTVGQDLVAMCVNDILVHGAEPLFFLDYIATGKLEPQRVSEIVKGIAEGCQLAGCSLIGGETAEMPGFYASGEYDLAGFAVGVVERSQIIDGSKVRVGDVLIGLPSSGLHSNGYSLARKIFFDNCGWTVDKIIPELGRTLGEELLTPTFIYARQILDILLNVKVHGMTHITGGGLLENIPRSLSPGTGVVINSSSWQVPPIFKLLQDLGNVPDDEMFRVFNMGIGFVLILPPEDVDEAVETLKIYRTTPCQIGEVVSGEGVVVSIKKIGG